MGGVEANDVIFGRKWQQESLPARLQQDSPDSDIEAPTTPKSNTGSSAFGENFDSVSEQNNIVFSSSQSPSTKKTKSYPKQFEVADHPRKTRELENALRNFAQQSPLKNLE